MLLFSQCAFAISYYRVPLADAVKEAVFVADVTITEGRLVGGDSGQRSYKIDVNTLYRGVSPEVVDTTEPLEVGERYLLILPSDGLKALNMREPEFWIIFKIWRAGDGLIDWVGGKETQIWAKDDVDDMDISYPEDCGGKSRITGSLFNFCKYSFYVSSDDLSEFMRDIVANSEGSIED